jgi:Holliday junction resolvase RusA-like endonuclease
MSSPDTISTTRTMRLQFWVPGTPKPQGSKRAFQHPHTKRIVLTEASGDALRMWRQEVKTYAVYAMEGRPAWAAPTGIYLSIGFVLHRPRNLPKTRATPLAVKVPDLDKLVRGVCDALTGTVYADDSQVVSFNVWKRTAELDEPTGAQLTVETLDLIS